MPRNKGKAAVEEIRLERLEVEYVPIDSVSPNDYNPNRQDLAGPEFAMLKRSMEEDGFTQPIVVDRASRQIVDGEHRWRAALALGMTEIPVVLTDMDEAQRKLSTLRHNRARGSEDQDLTAALFRDIRELGALDAAQDALGLSAAELERILDDTPAPEALAGEEFGQAWEPVGSPYGRSEKLVTEDGRDQKVESATPAALERLEAANEALANATTEDERVAAMKSRGLFRLNFMYTNEEAQIIQQALGDHPAARIVELCRARDVEPVAG